MYFVYFLGCIRVFVLSKWNFKLIVILDGLFSWYVDVCYFFEFLRGC